MSYNVSDSAKVAMIVTTVVVQFGGICAVALAFWKRKEYPPFKAKQLPAVALSLLAACFWSIGNLHSLSILDMTNPVWANCILWILW